jgi:hypothetical protein
MRDGVYTESGRPAVLLRSVQNSPPQKGAEQKTAAGTVPCEAKAPHRTGKLPTLREIIFQEYKNKDVLQSVLRSIHKKRRTKTEETGD